VLSDHITLSKDCPGLYKEKALRRRRKAQRKRFSRIGHALKTRRSAWRLHLVLR
jgi:hypothetical protein